MTILTTSQFLAPYMVAIPTEIEVTFLQERLEVSLLQQQVKVFVIDKGSFGISQQELFFLLPRFVFFDIAFHPGQVFHCVRFNSIPGLGEC